LNILSLIFLKILIVSEFSENETIRMINTVTEAEKKIVDEVVIDPIHPMTIAGPGIFG
jgi:hypothetical protein